MCHRVTQWESVRAGMREILVWFPDQTHSSLKSLIPIACNFNSTIQYNALNLVCFSKYNEVLLVATSRKPDGKFHKYCVGIRVNLRAILYSENVKYSIDMCKLETFEHHGSVMRCLTTKPNNPNAPKDRSLI